MNVERFREIYTIHANNTHFIRFNREINIDDHIEDMVNMFVNGSLYVKSVEAFKEDTAELIAELNETLRDKDDQVNVQAVIDYLLEINYMIIDSETLILPYDNEPFALIQNEFDNI